MFMTITWLIFFQISRDNVNLNLCQQKQNIDVCCKIRIYMA